MLDIKPMAGAIGAEIYGLDLTSGLTCRFQWQPDSLPIWDNRCTQHRPVNDYFPAHRRMERITIDGDKPY